mgnify:CR=1 FL=1
MLWALEESVGSRGPRAWFALGYTGGAVFFLVGNHWIALLNDAALTIGWQGIVVGAFGLTWTGSFDSPYFVPVALFAGVLYTYTTYKGVKGLERVAVPSTVVLALVGLYAGWFNVDKAGGWDAFLNMSASAAAAQPLTDEVSSAIFEKFGMRLMTGPR